MLRYSIIPVQHNQHNRGLLSRNWYFHAFLRTNNEQNTNHTILTSSNFNYKCFFYFQDNARMTALETQMQTLTTLMQSFVAKNQGNQSQQQVQLQPQISPRIPLQVPTRRSKIAKQLIADDG